MPNRSLLLFSLPELASRSSLGGGRGNFHRPSHYRQGVRLTPKFTQLQQTFNLRRAEIQQTMAGIDPEQVLVIETIGSVKDFANAAKRISGLEFLGEIEVDDIVPDEDFFDENKPQKELNGRLYLVVTNQRALSEMLSLWRRYKRNSRMEFARGLTKFRDIFQCLKDIRRWGVKDRLLETGVIEAWQEDLQHDPSRIIRFETELWFRASSTKRDEKYREIESLINQLGGRIHSQCLIEEIAYHALLSELPAAAIQNIISNQNTELVQCDNIMFFKPVGQISFGAVPDVGSAESSISHENPLPSGSPIVAIFDGMPLSNHQLLANRLIIDDPDNWETAYAAAERVHGTAMTSLIIYGDLNDSSARPLSTPVYVRPIMKPLPNDLISPHREFIPDDVLAVDLVHRAVKRIFEKDSDEGPFAPTVKVINLSIGDPTRQFANTISPLARLIDWLSTKYNVLFVISAGNNGKKLEISVSHEDFEQLNAAELEAETVKGLYRNARLRKIIMPAESINGLTVGAAHCDHSPTPASDGRFDPFQTILPSPISTFGSGYRRGIKPDLLYMSGKQLFRKCLGSFTQPHIEPAQSLSVPGNKVAAPGTASSLDSTAHYCGTSNAAALVSRMAVKCHDTVTQIFHAYSAGVNYQEYITCILKAMLVHGCAWGNMGQRLREILNTATDERQLKNWISQWIGYGMPGIERVLFCTEQRASLIGFGKLLDGQAHSFQLPLPPSLVSRRDWRRLTVTLAWLSPIAVKTQKYRLAGLWFEPVNSDLTPSRTDVNWDSARRGTLQHELFEGDRAIPFRDGDSIKIKINCRNDAGKIIDPIPYGLVVSLEVREGVDIAVYDEIRARITPTVRIQPSERR